ncbi:MAG: hypothetical protein ABL934_05430 [Lysobacteraceae bacterium]
MPPHDATVADFVARACRWRDTLAAAFTGMIVALIDTTTTARTSV